MCGIAGLLGLGPETRSVSDTAVLRGMADALARREGRSGPCASASVHPRSLACGGAAHALGGRHVIVVTGEIYNHLDLRKALTTEGAKIAWKGHSDTETLLAAITHWGLDAALRKSTGMFALALWDKDTRTLSLARDRTGEKPLHVAILEKAVAFASELQAFHAVPGFTPSLDPQVLRGFVSTAAVADDSCISASVRKLQPGTILTIGAAGGTMEQRV